MGIETATLSLSEVLENEEDSANEALSSFVNDIKNNIECFKCCKSTYHEDFLKKKSSDHDRNCTSKTYLMLNRGLIKQSLNGQLADSDKSKLIAAYFTLGLSSIVIDDRISGKMKKLLENKHYLRGSSLGCFVIGELCRSEDYARQDITGDVILNESLGIINKAKDIIGGRLVLVDSREEVFETLYKPRGFKKVMTADNNTLDGAPLLTSFLKIA